MDDWLLKYEKQMRDWINLEYQKKLDARLERVRRALDSRHPEYKGPHNDLDGKAAKQKEVTRWEPRLPFSVFCWICIALAVIILFSDHPRLAALPIEMLCLISLGVYKRGKKPPATLFKK